MDTKPHKVMTPAEYDAMPIIGWHQICRNVDGFGNVGVRFLSFDRDDKTTDQGESNG